MCDIAIFPSFSVNCGNFTEKSYDCITQQRGTELSMSRSVRKGGCTWCTCIPPPPPIWEKSSAQKCPKEERKFGPDMLAKKNVHVPLRCHKIKTKKLWKKKKIVKGKG